MDLFDWKVAILPGIKLQRITLKMRRLCRVVPPEPQVVMGSMLLLLNMGGIPKWCMCSFILAPDWLMYWKSTIHMPGDAKWDLSDLSEMMLGFYFWLYWDFTSYQHAWSFTSLEHPSLGHHANHQHPSGWPLWLVETSTGTGWMIHGRRVESPVARFLVDELLIALQSCEDPICCFENMVLKKSPGIS